MQTMNRKYQIIVILFLIFSAGELIGRYYGLCSYPLYIESNEYEYIHTPNQDITIYGNQILTNEYSMRSLPIDLEKDTSVVLLIGDSMINGGNFTDHQDLASTKLEKKLSAYYNKSIRVLNISSGSWGPDNGAAYVKKHGTFDADLIVLVVSSHDAYDNMTFEQVVGKNAGYPNKQSTLAWSKIIEKIMMRIKEFSMSFSATNDARFNSGFQYFSNLTKKKKIPFIVYLHPDKEEIKRKRFFKIGVEIINFCKTNEVILVDELSLGIDSSYLRDDIHYNEKGQQFCADNLFSISKNYPL